MKRIVIAAVLAILTIWAVLRISGATDQKEKTDMDITFVISGEIAERGGLVQIVFLEQADANPVTEPFEVPLTSVASAVLVTIPVGATYTYRFRRFDHVDKGQTKRFAVGTYSAGTTLDSIYVDMGGDWTLDLSHRLAAVTAISAAQDYYPCQTLAGAIVCDMSSELDRELPK